MQCSTTAAVVPVLLATLLASCGPAVVLERQRVGAYRKALEKELDACTALVEGAAAGAAGWWPGVCAGRCDTRPSAAAPVGGPKRSRGLIKAGIQGVQFTVCCTD